MSLFMSAFMARAEVEHWLQFLFSTTPEQFFFRGEARVVAV